MGQVSAGRVSLILVPWETVPISTGETSELRATIAGPDSLRPTLRQSLLCSKCSHSYTLPLLHLDVPEWLDMVPGTPPWKAHSDFPVPRAVTR